MGKKISKQTIAAIEDALARICNSAISKECITITKIQLDAGVPSGYPLKESLIRLGIIDITQDGYIWKKSHIDTMQDLAYKALVAVVIDKMSEIMSQKRKEYKERKSNEVFAKPKIIFGSQAALASFSDDEIINELKSRGFAGSLQKRVTITKQL